jgi:threonine dehydrogenase-like Zn-dependent dehydrogenase
MVMARTATLSQRPDQREEVIDMRALVLAEFGRMVVEERPDPTPARGEVLIRIVATGICGSDIHGFTGANGRRVPGQVMGHESVGRVASQGEGVDGLEIGHPVTFNPVVIPDADVQRYAGREQRCPNKYVIGVKQDVVSAFAEYVAVPARNVVPLREDMPIEHGALIEPLAVAVHAVRRVDAGRELAALVVGGGPIGQSIVLALAMEGVEHVVVSEIDPSRRALVERLGARAVDPAAGPVPEQVERLLDGRVDVALDAAGVSGSVADALASTVPGGSVCLVGMGSPTLELSAFAVSTEERSLVGSFTYSAQDFRDAAQWISTRPAVAGELISRQVGLDEAPAAFTSLAARDGTPGKVLVRFDQ